MVVDPQVQIAIVEASVSTFRFDDEDRGGLLTSTVTTRAVTGFQRGQQSPREMTGCRLKRLQHCRNRLLSYQDVALDGDVLSGDRKSTRLNSSHANISYAVFCLKKKKKNVEF